MSAARCAWRQREVIRLSAEGFSNKEIASQLHISEATVKHHVGKVLERLHLKSRYHLAGYNGEPGRIAPPDGRYRPAAAHPKNLSFI